MEFIKPSSIELDSADGKIWANAMAAAELNYKRMLELNCSPQIARSVLPNSLKTEIVAKFNVRSFRNFLTLRMAWTAHPDMREVAEQCYMAAVCYGFAPLVNDCVEGD